MLNRFKAAIAAFRSPNEYRDGVSFAEIVRGITLYDKGAIVLPDPKTGFVVHAIYAGEAHRLWLRVVAGL